MLARLCFGLFAIALMAVGTSREVFTPARGNAFEESWRWGELEELQKLNLNCASESSSGRMWFGTPSGVVSFDGENIETYSPFGNESAFWVNCIYAISDEEVYASSSRSVYRFDGTEWAKLADLDFDTTTGNYLARTNDGAVWLASRSGLYRYRDNNLDRVSLRAFSAALVDSAGRLWLGEKDTSIVYVSEVVGGVLQDESEWKAFKPNRISSVDGASVSLYEGRDGRIWVADNDPHMSIRWIDRNLRESIGSSSRPVGGKDMFRLMAETNDGTLWLSDGRVLYTYLNDEWKIMRSSDFEIGDIPFSFSILHCTKEESLLLGGMRSSVYRIDYSDDNWETYLDLNYHCEDLSGRQWFLGKDRSLVYHDLKTDVWITLGGADGIIDFPNRVFCSREGTVWVSGSHDGVAAVSYLDGGKWVRKAFSRIGQSFSHLSVFETEDGRVLFGNGSTWTWGRLHDGGIISFSKSGEEYAIQHLKPPEVPERIVGIGESLEGDLWFGGLNLVRARKGSRFEIVSIGAEDRVWVDYVTSDSQGRIWVNAWGEGVYTIDQESLTLHNSDSGTCSDRVVHLHEDSTDQSIWLSTGRGVSRFDGKSWTRLALPEKISNLREGGTIRQSRNGDIWTNVATRNWNFKFSSRVGEELSDTTDGRFYTVRYRKDYSPPNTILLSYKERISEAGNAYVSWTGSDKWSRTLVDALEYSYRVDGGDWSDYEPRTEAFLMDLAEGDHVFEVRARDSDWNIDPTPAVIEFFVEPILWKRPWFIAAVSLTALTVIGLVVVLIRARVAHLIQIREFKIWFFTQISHELRNPLSVILGPIEMAIRNSIDDKSRAALSIARRNVHKIQHIVNQLLDFQKVELGGEAVHLTPNDLIIFIAEHIETMRPLAERKRQRLEFKHEAGCLRVLFDVDKVEKIFDNLVSNAIKYTPEGGRVEVSVRTGADVDRPESTLLYLVVEDSGIGIAESEQSAIFKPFHRVKRQSMKNSVGTGIGLALVRDLVEVCGGDIRVESPIYEGGSGSRFTVSLPVSLAEDEGSSLEDYKSDPSSVAADGGREVILIVDDNRDIRRYLRIELEDAYKIHEAMDGEEAFRIAKSLERLDLVVTDVVMPVVDGNQLCRALKQDVETCHIPVIVLTAQQAVSHEVDSLEHGADDYLLKPIQVEVLKKRIENQFTRRKTLHERFERERILTPSDSRVKTYDMEFLERAVQVVEEGMGDTLLTVESLGSALNVQRMTLYRKMKALTGMSPKGFIDSFRYKRAAQLLETEGISVSEVQVRVGILDSSQFSRWFKSEFKCTPTEYRNRKLGAALKS